MTSKERSKNAFIKQAASSFGITKRQAGSLYSEFSKKYGGLVRGSDLRKHPIVARRLVEQTAKSNATAPARKSGKTSSGAVGQRGEPERRSSVRTIEDWNDVYDDYDFEPVEYESSADYGEV